MFVCIKRYQEACEAFDTFIKDVSQLTQQMWEEVGKRQFELLRLCQDSTVYSGERQIQVLGNGFSWKEGILEQSNIAIDFWRQSLSNWGHLFNSFTETSAQWRSSVSRIELFWTPTVWEEAREKVGQTVDTARQEVLEQISETASAVGVIEQPRKRASERRIRRPERSQL